MARKRGSRFRKASDAQKQLEEIEQAQQDSRNKRTGKFIERTDKSEKRFDNSLKRIRKQNDLDQEYP